MHVGNTNKKHRSSEPAKFGYLLIAPDISEYLIESL